MLSCSSAFRELKKYRRDFSSWCEECKRKKKEKERLLVMATQQVTLIDKITTLSSKINVIVKVVIVCFDVAGINEEGNAIGLVKLHMQIILYS